MNITDKEQKLKELAAQIAVCERCDLHLSRTHSVPGEGPAGAEIMLVGEAPGATEDRQGRPFVGSSGRLLSSLLEQGGLKREQVFITNIVKSRPPENRDPQPDELAACAPWLDQQIEVIDPLVIITLGRFSMAHFLPKAKISQVHGQPEWVGGRMIIPMYHPAAALHQQALRSTLEADFARLPDLLAEARKTGRGSAKPTQ